MNYIKGVSVVAWSAWVMAAAPVIAGTVNEPQESGTEKWGSWSGKVQSITMYRDYKDLGKSSGSNTSVGVELVYRSPQCGPFDAGLTYNVAGDYAKNGNSLLNCNEDINVLTEAWLRGQLVPGWSATLGRQVVNGEVFRADPFRQKARALEALRVEFSGVDNLQVSGGHAIGLSNWIQDRDRADFNNFGDVFGAGADTNGVSWFEGCYTGLDGWELAMFDAYADDVAHLSGTRMKWQWSPNTALLGNYRHEEHDGGGGADAFGLAIEQKLGGLTVECGSFSVRGQTLKFQETTTGLNHALGSLMLICDDPYAGGADSGYVKAVCSVDSTVIYGLYAYTRHEDQPFNGQELNLVAKHSLSENLSVAVKLGLGLRDLEAGGNQTLTDARLFVTCLF